MLLTHGSQSGIEYHAYDFIVRCPIEAIDNSALFHGMRIVERIAARFP
jgi:hypothetical protein